MLVSRVGANNYTALVGVNAQISRLWRTAVDLVNVSIKSAAVPLMQMKGFDPRSIL